MPSTSLSVLIVAGGGRRQFVHEAIASVRSDSGTSEVPVVVTDFEDPRLEGLANLGEIQFVLCRKELGEMIAEGVGQSDSEYIAFLDDDDLFVPGRTRRLRALLTRYPGCGYYHVGYRFFWGSQVQPCLARKGRPEEEPGGNAPVHHFPRRGRGRDEADDWFSYLCSGNHEQNLSSTVLHRSILEGAWDELRALQGATDTFALFAALGHGSDLLFDDSIGTMVRRHPRNQSANPRYFATREAMRGVIARLVSEKRETEDARMLLRVRQARERVLDFLSGGDVSALELRQAFSVLARPTVLAAIPKNSMYGVLALSSIASPRLGRWAGRPYLRRVTP